MALTFSSDILALYAANVATDPAYQYPGTYNIPSAYVAGSTVNTIAVTTAGTGYTSRPTVGFSGGSPSVDATATAAMKAVSAAMAATGTGYTVGQTITLTGGTFSAAAVVTVVTAALATLALNAAGTGYAIGDTITLSGGTNTIPVVLTVATLSTTAIATFTISTRGAYTGALPTTFTQLSTSGAGTGATFQTGVWGVGTVSLTTPGIYTVLPSNPVAQGSTSGSGTGATMTMNWGVLSVTVTGSGTGYLGIPTANILGGGGTGAVLATTMVASAMERGLITVVEVIRSYMATMTSAQQAKAFHEVMRKMISALPMGGGATFVGATVAANAQKRAVRAFAGMVRNPNL